MKTADQCLRYLYSTKYFEIEYSAHEKSSLMVQSNAIMKTTTDASFVNDKNKKNDEEYIFKFFENLIDWTARKQLTVITSTIEAEFLSMFHAEKKII